MNNDELYCARAIVVAKAIADEDPQLKLVTLIAHYKKIGANPT